jgi:hypothetical protein
VRRVEALSGVESAPRKEGSALKNKTTMTVVLVIIIVVAVAAILWQVFGRGGGAVEEGTGKDLTEPLELQPGSVPPPPDPGPTPEAGGGD